MRRFILSVVLCAASVAALAAGPYDGVYMGTVRLAGGPLMRRCDPGTSFSIRVTESAFRWSGGGETVMVKVGPDGSFNAQSGPRFLAGRIADGKLTATTRSQYCNYDWSLTR